MIKLENICAGYGNENIISDITYSLPKGKNLVILGPNGCGKTTLLRVIAGLLPAQGSVQVCGLNPQTAPRGAIAKKIALMGQMPFATFGYSVKEAVMMGRYAHRSKGVFSNDEKRDEEITEECLNAVGLADLKSKSITELSGGQLQRVFLARTLCQQPEVILLDEPTNHMDLKHQAELIAYLNEWSRDENHTVVGVLHDLTLAMQLADEAILMKNGQIAASGELNAVFKPDILKSVFDMDLNAYMIDTLRRWEEMSK